MDKKLLAICLMTVTAVGLMLANFSNRPADASTALSVTGYQIATGHLVAGDEGLYVLDNRTGVIAVFSYDPAFKQLRPRDAIAASAAVGVPAK